MENKQVLEQVAWRKDAFLHWWDLYRTGGGLEKKADQDGLKGYQLFNRKTGKHVAFVLLCNKTPDQIREGHLRGGHEDGCGWGWVAKEISYEEAQVVDG